MTVGGGDRGPYHDKTSAQQLEYAALFGILCAFSYYAIYRLVPVNLPTVAHIFVSMGVSGVLTTGYARRQINKRVEKQAKIKREYNEMMEANTQKQIDAMLRGNSKIPKVKR